MTNDDIHDLIATEVAVAVQGAILWVFGFVKNIIVELFDERYAYVFEAATAAATTAVTIAIGRGGDSF